METALRKLYFISSTMFLYYMSALYILILQIRIIRFNVINNLVDIFHHKTS